MVVGCTCTSKRAGKYWRLAYRLEGKQKTLALGVYPAITLAQARRGRDDARALLAQGIDPSQNKQRLKEDKAVAALNTVEAMYRAYLANKRPGWSTTHYDREARSLEKDLYPFLGPRVIGEVEPTELLKACERVRDRDAVESAHRLLTTASGVWQYAIARGCATRDIAQDIKKALKPRQRGISQPSPIQASWANCLMRLIVSRTPAISATAPAKLKRMQCSTRHQPRS
jgi:hypothetical protein